MQLDGARRREIRELHAEGWSTRGLARRFGVSPAAIRYVLRGCVPGRESARRAGVPIPPAPAPVRPPPARAEGAPPGGRSDRLGEAERREIRELHAGGWSIHRLARRFGVCRSTISRLVRGKTWPGDPGAPPPPATGPRPVRWREPKGANRSRRGNDADGDLAVPLEPPAAAELPAAGPAAMPPAATDVDEDWGEVPCD